MVGRPRSKTWWRNFRNPASLSVRHRGRDFEAVATLVRDYPNRQCELLSDYPCALRNAKLGQFRDPESPSKDELRAAAANLMFVLVERRAPVQAVNDGR